MHKAENHECIADVRPLLNMRPQLVAFAQAMEQKLRKNDHKNATTGGWRNQPLEAFIKLMKLEIAEFDVADEFFTVADARKELIDISNFAMIVHDLLGMLDQDKNRHAQGPVTK